VYLFWQAGITDIFLPIWNALRAKISDKPDDIRLCADDKLHNTSGAI